MVPNTLSTSNLARYLRKYLASTRVHYKNCAHSSYFKVNIIPERNLVAILGAVHGVLLDLVALIFSEGRVLWI